MHVSQRTVIETMNCYVQGIYVNAWLEKKKPRELFMHQALLASILLLACVMQW
jgi:hypothetical protein